ncbi:MAG: hypothetical protein NXI23_12550 [Bacteroidetes bacterium]|nr:hypothetical protein [Bacteroidota bacterium]
MIRNLFTIMIMVLSVSFSYGQSVTILDQEAPATTVNFGCFAGAATNNVIANPNPSGINTSGSVGDITKPFGAQSFAGCFSTSSAPVVLSGGADEICIDVHMDHIGNLALKLEASSNGGPNWITTVANTKINEWEQLCFPVAANSIEGPFSPATGFDYNTFVLFFDFLSPADGKTSYFDNMVVNMAGPPPPPPTIPASPYCATQVTHFGGNPESAVLLTIENTGPNTMIVQVESADSDPVDDLIIPGGGFSVSPKDESVPGIISVTLTFAVPPTDAMFNVLWSKGMSPGGGAGNWQLSMADISIPFLASCSAPNAIPTMGEWSLFYLALIMLSLGIVFVMQFQTQMQLSVAGSNKKVTKFSLNQMPFDKVGYGKAFKIALTIVPFGFAFIYIMWGEIIFDDLIGMTLSIPLVAYLIYLLKK